MFEYEQNPHTGRHLFIPKDLYRCLIDYGEEIKAWCEEQFGEEGETADCRYSYFHNRYVFTRDEDAFAFRMRWC